jgi:hypothetical protein
MPVLQLSVAEDRTARVIRLYQQQHIEPLDSGFNCNWGQFNDFMSSAAPGMGVLGIGGVQQANPAALAQPGQQLYRRLRACYRQNSCCRNSWQRPAANRPALAALRRKGRAAQTAGIDAGGKVNHCAALCITLRGSAVVRRSSTEIPAASAALLTACAAPDQRHRAGDIGSMRRVISAQCGLASMLP